MDIFEIIIGSYESFVIGVKFRLINEKCKEVELVQSFNDHVHQASIRAVACSSKYMVSSSTDETVEVYNMVKRCHIHTILQHSGTVTSLSFTPDESHLISTSEDGSIAIYETGSWKLKKLWDKAHKGSGVSCLAVHPSGKLALSVGKDKTLRTWNLVKGRPAYTTNHSSLGAYYFFEKIIWSPIGQYYALPLNTKLIIYSVETAGIIFNIECDQKIHGTIFLSENLVCFGTENGFLKCYDIIKKEKIWDMKIGDIRVKCLSKVDEWFITALSDGHITVWELKPNKKPVERCSIFLDCRVTCMAYSTSHSKQDIKNESEEECEGKDEILESKIIVNLNSETPKSKLKRKIQSNSSKKKMMKSSLKRTYISQSWNVSDDN
ncbi:p21-activated protein kinase-interacting protein 1-like isoform X1 [Daktulosphaira vitifoliae]|uniref:p21-activated protein kinase-interacting protein 1-like isoform X1 n=2 Tax=Daktulosphaira vitifoliae TaxID=58002 RepID=UPI0021AAF647|nr:p21-activated protein kinase-interacting protein 1-like isoform X1 [Daktulosphaira vitifoliae]